MIKTHYYDEKNGLPGSYNINLFTLENKLIFSSDSGFMLYDEISNRFTPYKELNKGLGSFANSNKIISAGIKKYWFINHGKTAMVDFSEPGKLLIDSNRLSLLDGRMVQYYENISPISNTMHLVSVDDGFVIYDAIAGNNPGKKKVLPAVLIRRVED